MHGQCSGVRLRVEDEHVPRVSGVSLTDALASGEEYELVVTASADAIDGTAFERAFGLAVTRIGVVEHAAGSAGDVVLVDRNGAPSRVDLPLGHDHLSR